MGRYVITGGPCTGKTTTLNGLSSKGFNVVEESARLVIASEQKKLAENPSHNAILPWTNISKFQRMVSEEQFRREQEAKEIPVFFDRGLIDNLAYIKVFGGELDDVTTNIISKANYTKVFILDPVEYLQDEVRKEDPELAKKIHKAIHDVYTEKSFKVLKVPLMPVNQRIDFILQNL